MRHLKRFFLQVFFYDCSYFYTKPNLRIQLISTAGGRFPRAWLEPPRSMLLWGLKAHAFPAGVAALRFNQLFNSSVIRTIKQFYTNIYINKLLIRIHL